MRRNFTINLSVFLLCILLVLESYPSVSTQQQLTKSELIEYAKLIRRQRIQPLLLADGRQIAVDEDCGTRVLWEFQKALDAASLSDADRDEVFSVFDIEGTVSEYNTTHFNIKYTEDNTSDQVRDHTVDTAVDVTLTDDPNIIGTTVAGNDHPDFVEQVGIWLEHSLGRYKTEGFRDPVPSGQITVYIEDLGYLGMASSSAIWIDNDLSDYYMQATPTHELFHRVQFMYDWDEWWIMEGTARWSVDMVNDNLNRYMRETRPYLSNMDRDLTDASYAAVTFWKCFSEQHTNIYTEPIIGVDAIKELFDSMESYDDVDAVNRAIKNLPKGRSIYSTFKYWLIANYVKDKGDPYINPMYDYLEDEQTEFGSANGFGSVMPVVTYDLTSTSGAYSISDTVNNWGADYYVINPNTTVNDITVSVNSDIGFSDPSYIILTIKDNYATIYQSRLSDYNKVFHNPPGSLDELVVIVGAFEDGGSYDLEIKANEGIPALSPIDVGLVIDCSGSMGYYHYIEPTKNYGKLFVDLLQPEDRIGVVSFAVKPSPTPKAIEEYQLTEIPITPPPDVKSEAKDALEGLTLGNTTPLGEGLMKSQQEINDYGLTSHPQAIVLLSDGEENVAPFVSKTKDPSSTILSDINADGIAIYTLILGPSADWAMNLLQEIAEETDGHSEYFLLASLDFAEVFMMLRTAILQDDLLRIDRGQVGQADTYSPIYEVNTDSSTDVLLLSAAWEKEASHLDFELQPPGRSDWINISEITADPNMNIINESVYQIIRISIPSVGRWRYRLKFTNVSTTTEGYVLSAITDRLDINMNVGIEGTRIAGDMLLLTAKLTNKGNPLVGGQVSALAKIPQRSLSSTITFLWDRLQLHKIKQDTPQLRNLNEISRRIQIIDHLRKELATDELVEYTSHPITLHDDGQDGDLRAGDGTYSAKLSLTNTKIAGTYKFTINAKSAPNSTLKFQREAIITAQIDIAQVEPTESIVRLSKTEAKPDGTRIFEILVIGIDKYGNTLWPGFPSDISIRTDKGHLLGKIMDNEDTSYSQMLELKKDQEANLYVTIRGVELPPISTVRPTYPWNIYAFGGTAIPIDTLSDTYEIDKNIIFGLGYSITHNFALLGMVGYNWFGAKSPDASDTKIMNISANARYSFLRGRMSPYFGGGLGLYLPDEGDSEFGANLSLGIDYFMSRRLNIEVGVDFHAMFNSDKTKFIHTHAGIVFKF